MTNCFRGGHDVEKVRVRLSRCAAFAARDGVGNERRGLDEEAEAGRNLACVAHELRTWQRLIELRSMPARRSTGCLGIGGEALACEEDSP